jgi:uroporphyrinogen III methyltransferase/synthase
MATNDIGAARGAYRPLAGRRIVVTRARTQAGGLAGRIEELGGEVIEFPTIEIQPPASFAALDAAIARIADYDWLIFTSVNGVAFLARFNFRGNPWPNPSNGCRHRPAHGRAA